jgi:acetamidase/formamidase
VSTDGPGLETQAGAFQENGAGAKLTDHTVESTPETIRSGFLDPKAAPVASVASGDIVRYPHTWTHWGNEAVYGMTFADREPLRHRYPYGPYSVIGPVEVRGAEPGDTIECSLLALRTIDWGWNSFPLGVGALSADFKEPYVHYFRFNAERTPPSSSTASSCRWRRSSASWPPSRPATTRSARS